MLSNGPALPDASKWLTYDPSFIDPALPSGFWLCDSLEDACCVKINAGCLGTGVPLAEIGKCEPFFSAFHYVLIVCPNSTRRDAIVAEVRRRLQSTVLLVAEDKAFQGCKTLRELKETYGLKAIDRILLDTRELPGYGLLDLADVKQPNIVDMERVLSGIGNLDRYIGGFFMGELSVWTGKRGDGKSTILGQMLLEALDQSIPVCAYSGELPAWKFKYWTMLQAAGPRYITVGTDKRSERKVSTVPETVSGLIDAWWRGRFLLYDIGTSSTHDGGNILRVFHYAYRRYGAKVFLVDNIMTARFAGREKDFYRAQSDFVSELSAFAKKTGTHVHLVAHPRKTDKQLDTDDVGGIGDITNFADNVFSIERQIAESREQDSVLSILKNRFFGERGRCIGLNYDDVSKRFYKTGSGDPNKRYGWEFTGSQIAIEDDGAPDEDPFESTKRVGA